MSMLSAFFGRSSSSESCASSSGAPSTSAEATPPPFDPSPLGPLRPIGSIAYGPQLTDKNCWYIPDPAGFVVRGKNYLSDHKKIVAKPPLCRTLGIDVLATPKKIPNVLARTDLSSLQSLLKDHQLFVTNFIMPGLQLCIYFQMPQAETPETATGLRLLRRFMSRESPNEYRDVRFKIIPLVRVGPWVVRHAVGAPAILPTKMRTAYYWGDRDSFEIDIDIASNVAGGTIFSLTKGYLRSLVLEIGFVIEGQCEDDLPEHIFGVFGIKHLNLEEHLVHPEVHDD